SRLTISPKPPPKERGLDWPSPSTSLTHTKGESTWTVKLAKARYLLSHSPRALKSVARASSPSCRGMPLESPFGSGETALADPRRRLRVDCMQWVYARTPQRSRCAPCRCRFHRDRGTPATNHDITGAM